jgi:anti-anti-sigma regulatory factor
MNLTLDESTRNGILSLEGEMTLPKAGEFKASLKEALGAADHIVIDLRRVSELDLSCLQLLCSAHRTSVGLNKGLGIATPRPEALRQWVERAGLTRHVGCPQDVHHTCLWSGGL